MLRRDSHATKIQKNEFTIFHGFKTFFCHSWIFHLPNKCSVLARVMETQFCRVSFTLSEGKGDVRQFTLLRGQLISDHVPMTQFIDSAKTVTVNRVPYKIRRRKNTQQITFTAVRPPGDLGTWDEDVLAEILMWIPAPMEGVDANTNEPIVEQDWQRVVNYLVDCVFRQHSEQEKENGLPASVFLPVVLLLDRATPNVIRVKQRFSREQLQRASTIPAYYPPEPVEWVPHGYAGEGDGLGPYTMPAGPIPGDASMMPPPYMPY